MHIGRGVSLALRAGGAGVLALSCVMVAAPAAQAAVTGHYTENGVRIRSCPSTSSSCGILGLGYPSQPATIYCYKTGTVIEGSPYWYYNRNQSTGVTGYSADAYMNFNGSVSRC